MLRREGEKVWKPPGASRRVAPLRHGTRCRLLGQPRRDWAELCCNPFHARPVKPRGRGGVCTCETEDKSIAAKKPPTGDSEGPWPSF